MTIRKCFCFTVRTTQSSHYLLVGAHRVGVVSCSGLLAEVKERQLDDKSRLPESVADEKVVVGTLLAEPIVRKFMCKSSIDKAVSFESWVGSVPWMEFECRESVVSFVKIPISEEIVPVRELVWRSMTTIGNGIALAIA